MSDDKRSRFVAEEDQITFHSAKSLCRRCKHKTSGKSTCTVFPKRIPKDILRGGECLDHKEQGVNDEQRRRLEN